MTKKTNRNRKGYLEISREFILKSDADILRIVFSNFTPLSSEKIYIGNHWNSVKYYGISKHFKELKDDCLVPEYEMWLECDDNGNVGFDRMVKL